jgi:hypothetical protein
MIKRPLEHADCAEDKVLVVDIFYRPGVVYVENMHAVFLDVNKQLQDLGIKMQLGETRRSQRTA